VPRDLPAAQAQARARAPAVPLRMPQRRQNTHALFHRLPPSRRTPEMKTKAHIRVVTLNMKGRGAGSEAIRTSQKWRDLNMRVISKGIGILAIQETHLADHHIPTLEEMYQHLRIFNSPLPDSTNRGGVAILLNKQRVNTEGARQWTLIEGRAIVVSIDWNRGQRLSILAVYAPTNPTENKDFWYNVRAALEAMGPRIPKPQLMVGDFNCVESARDRYPAHLNTQDASASFLELTAWLGLVDGWRRVHPNQLRATYRERDRGISSRIDRIYIAEELFTAARDWSNELLPFLSSDHSPAQVDLVNLTMPFVGPGRWTVTPRHLRLKELWPKVIERGRELLSEAEASEVQHVRQAKWDELKAYIRREAREQEAKRGATCDRYLKALEHDAVTVEQLAADGDLEQMQAASLLQELDERIETQRKSKRARKRQNAQVNARLHKETGSAQWWRKGKQINARDIIPEMRDPANADTLLKRSDEMAEAAMTYHNSLQDKDLNEPNARARDIEEVLDHMKALEEDQDRNGLGLAPTEDAVRRTIRSCQNGTAAGPDGLIWEVWKLLDQEWLVSEAQGFNVARLMALVFEEIQDQGLAEESSFSESWICPIYKGKGDKADISMHRLISCANTDYKTFTGTLTWQLGDLAPDLVHDSQFGFVQGRQITHATKLARLMVARAEKTGDQGVILSLDQEKAYDKVSHDYLFKVLRAMRLPERFVHTVEILYGSATSTVMINGVMSSPFRVRRGVRQGDPLSCLLFNFAIEPLSRMIRESGLEGFKIEGLTERLIATLFADDTTVYLSERDDWLTLKTILDKWCSASGAKFNEGKTEAIPIGSPEFCRNFTLERRAHATHTRLPSTVRITEAGVAIRILGAWAGNSVDDEDPWLKVLQKAAVNLERWDRLHPSLNARRQIIQAYIGGGTQYLTAAQGMPTDMASRVDKLAMDFLWEYKRSHTVDAATLKLTREDGGLGLLDIAARNDAIYIVWLREYAATGKQRPIWAYVADEVLRRTTTLECQDRTEGRTDLLDSFLTQDWTPTSTSAARENGRPNLQATGLPIELKMLVKVAKQYGATADAPMIDEQAKLDRSIWMHLERRPGRHPRLDRERLRCLRDRHLMRTVADATKAGCRPIEGERPHANRRNCACNCCQTLRQTHGCRNPNGCQTTARKMLSELGDKWKPGGLPDLSLKLGDNARRANERNLELDNQVIFDPSFPRTHHANEYVRIFTNSLAVTALADAPAAHNPTGFHTAVADGRNARQIICLGAVANPRRENASAAFAWQVGNQIDRTIRKVEESAPQTLERATALAIIDAIRNADRDTPLHIMLNSRRTLKRLTTAREKAELTGWHSCGEDGDVFRAAVAWMRAHRARIALEYVDPPRAGPTIGALHALVSMATENRTPRAEGPRPRAPQPTSIYRACRSAP